MLIVTTDLLQRLFSIAPSQAPSHELSPCAAARLVPSAWAPCPSSRAQVSGTEYRCDCGCCFSLLLPGSSGPLAPSAAEPPPGLALPGPHRALPVVRVLLKHLHSFLYPSLSADAVAISFREKTVANRQLKLLPDPAPTSTCLLTTLTASPSCLLTASVPPAPPGVCSDCSPSSLLSPPPRPLPLSAHQLSAPPCSVLIALKPTSRPPAGSVLAVPSSPGGGEGEPRCFCVCLSVCLSIRPSPGLTSLCGAWTDSPLQRARSWVAGFVHGLHCPPSATFMCCWRCSGSAYLCRLVTVDHPLDVSQLALETGKRTLALFYLKVSHIFIR